MILPGDILREKVGGEGGKERKTRGRERESKESVLLCRALNLTLNLRSSCLSLPSAGISGMHYPMPPFLFFFFFNIWTKKGVFFLRLLVEANPELLVSGSHPTHIYFKSFDLNAEHLLSTYSILALVYA